MNNFTLPMLGSVILLNVCRSGVHALPLGVAAEQSVYQGLKSSFASWEHFVKAKPSWQFFTYNLLNLPCLG
jgi:hypothetical protein